MAKQPDNNPALYQGRGALCYRHSMPWSRPFDFPVQGFRTLRDAADHIVSLPKAEQAKPHWQIAAFVLTEAAEGRGPMLHASIGMNKALNFGKPEPDRVPRHKQAKKYKIIR